MKTSFEIPFYASDLPCPIPTIAEIENTSDVLSGYGERKIVAVGQHFVVKFGLGVELLEGENMLFARENTNVPIPRVYALYSDPSTGRNYIVMERIIGQTLLSAWPQLTALEKRRTVSDLRRYFDELRRLPSPGYFGSFGKRLLLDGVFWTPEPDPRVDGPFDLEKDFAEAMVRKYQNYNGGSTPYRAEYLRKCFPLIFKDPEAAFTHCDFQRKNIMVRETNDQSKEEENLVIIDWEKSGWYPRYWEYCMAFCALRFDDDWPLWIDSILTPFLSEAAWLQSLRLSLWS